jgi:hypothetical protein
MSSGAHIPRVEAAHEAGAEIYRLARTWDADLGEVEGDRLAPDRLAGAQGGLMRLAWCSSA